MKFVLALFLGAVSAGAQIADCPAPAAVDGSCLRGVSTYLPAGAPGTLRTRTAGSATAIGAQQIVVPDKVRITDQAKVSETCGSSQRQSSEARQGRRSWTIDGGFQFSQSEKRSSRGSSSAASQGNQAGQAVRREQVESNLGGCVELPRTDLTNAPRLTGGVPASYGAAVIAGGAQGGYVSGGAVAVAAAPADGLCVCV